MSDEQEWAWAALQVGGPAAMSQDEQVVLARWLADCPPASDNELRPESELDAFNVLEFAKAIFNCGQPHAAERAARLAFEAFDALELKRGQFRTEALLLAARRTLAHYPPRSEDTSGGLREHVRNLSLRDAEDWPALVPDLESLGRALLEAGHDDDAVALYRLLREVVDSTMRERSELHARVRENLALAMLPRGPSDEIERLLRQSVKIREAVGGEAAADLWRSWTGLALLRADQLLFDEADGFAQQALQTAREHARGGDAEGQCDRLVQILRSRRVRHGHDGRLFGWALARIEGGPFTRSWRSLVEVAALVRCDAPSGTCSRAMENAARLLARAGAADAATELVERQLQWKCLYEDSIVTGVGAEAVRVLLEKGDLAAAATATERFFRFAGSVDAADGDAIVMARRNLIERLLDLERPEVEGFLREHLTVETLPLLDEPLLDAALERDDFAAVSAILDGWQLDHDELGTPDLQQAAQLAAKTDELDWVRRLATRLLKGNRPHEAIDVLLAAGLEQDAVRTLGEIEGGRARAFGLASLAVHAAGRGQCERFTRLAGEAVAALGKEVGWSRDILADRIGRAARACWTPEAAEAWCSEQLDAASGKRLLAALSPPPPASLPPPAPQPRIEPVSDIGRALQAGNLDAALAALKPAGNFHLDLIHAERVAAAANAAGRHDMAELALDFARVQLTSPPDPRVIMHEGIDETRYTTARRLGDAVRRYLSAERAKAFADRAFAAASVSSDIESAGALVTAAGCACRPGPAA